VATDLTAPRKIGPPSRDSLTLSSNFDVETCLARIRRDKASVVRSSFEASACCILESLDKSDDEVDLESIDDEDLPKELGDIPALEQIRKSSMIRSFDNKDPSKRKTSDGNTVTRAPRGKAAKKSDPSTPKFTRNTPASSAAALDSRLTGSRAILCAAANVSFDVLTPALPGLDVDVSDIPQNPSKAPEGAKSTVNNMGAVVVEAQTVGQRIAAVATNAARRSERRFQYRKDNVRYAKSPSSVLHMENPFAWTEEDNSVGTMTQEHNYDPQEGSLTQAWKVKCLSAIAFDPQDGRRARSLSRCDLGHAIWTNSQPLAGNGVERWEFWAASHHNGGT